MSENFRVRGKAVKVGDRVWNDLRGFGVVSGLDARHGRMPIEVNFPHAVEGFANRVYFNIEDELLFWEPSHDAK